METVLILLCLLFIFVFCYITSLQTTIKNYEETISNLSKIEHTQDKLIKELSDQVWMYKKEVLELRIEKNKYLIRALKAEKISEITSKILNTCPMIIGYRNNGGMFVFNRELDILGAAAFSPLGVIFKTKEGIKTQFKNLEEMYKAVVLCKEINEANTKKIYS